MPRKNPDLWMQRVAKKMMREGTKGALRRMLRTPKDKNIPVTFLREIVGTHIGRIAKNPTDVGIRRIRVTNLVKSRAVYALNAYGG